MIDYKYKPKYLPQVSAPYTIVGNMLKNNGVNFSLEEVDPTKLIPSQGITISDIVNNVDIEDRTKPIWISNNYEVLDGHHRLVRALQLNKPTIFCFKIGENKLDGARILNKIQDLYEYEKHVGKNISEKIDIGEYFNIDVNGEKSPMENVIGYRKEPIVSDSIIGNFFMLVPVTGYKKYEISFDNVLDVKDLNLNIKTGQSVIVELSKIWLPNYDFSKAKENEHNLRCAGIAIMAKKMGYDGIKYSDNLIQAL